MRTEIPSDDAVDRMLYDLGKGERVQPTDLKRHAARLRAYIEALREPSNEDLIRDLGEAPTSWEEPGIAFPNDALMDQLIVDAREWVRMRDGRAPLDGATRT